MTEQEPITDEQLAHWIENGHVPIDEEEREAVVDAMASELLNLRGTARVAERESREANVRIRELERDLKRARAHTPELEQLRRLVRDFTDTGDCWLDHHGGCQAHGYLEPEQGEVCPHAQARQLITAWEQEARE